jgi:uncharacterized protein
MDLFTNLQVEAESRHVLASGQEVHTAVMSNGRVVAVTPGLGHWVVLPDEGYRNLDVTAQAAALENTPGLEEALLRPAREERTPRAINPWVIKVADFCNMACSYCYEDAQPESKRMELELAEKLVDEMLSLEQSTYTVLFHGGEPTLNMDCVELIIRQLNGRAPKGTDIQYMMHTNLLAVDAAKQKRIKDLGIRIGSSLDGRGDVSDHQRVAVSGRGTHDRVVKNLQAMPARERYLILTITEENVNELLSAAQHFVEDLEVPSFHFLPLLPHGRPGVEEKVPDHEVMTEGIFEVFDYVLGLWSEGRRVHFRNLETPIRSLHAPAYTTACQSCTLGGTSAQSITVSWDGIFGPCDASANIPRLQLGNIRDCNHDLADYMSSGRNFRIFKNLQDIPGCDTCAVRMHCGGGCEEEALQPGESRTVYCDHYYRMYYAVMAATPELQQLGYRDAVLGKSKRGSQLQLRATVA